MARIPSRASRALRAASGWPSPGVVSHLSAACSGYLPTTALTRKTIPPPCTATSLRARSKTTWGSARTSARTNPSFRQQRLQDTQVQDLWYRNFKKSSVCFSPVCVFVLLCVNSKSNSARHALVTGKEESLIHSSPFLSWILLLSSLLNYFLSADHISTCPFFSPCVVLATVLKCRNYACPCIRG